MRRAPVERRSRGRSGQVAAPSDRLSRGVGVAGVGYVITRGITFATYIVLAQLTRPCSRAASPWRSRPRCRPSRCRRCSGRTPATTSTGRRSAPRGRRRHETQARQRSPEQARGPHTQVIMRSSSLMVPRGPAAPCVRESVFSVPFQMNSVCQHRLDRTLFRLFAHDPAWLNARNPPNMWPWASRRPLKHLPGRPSGSRAGSMTGSATRSSPGACCPTPAEGRRARRPLRHLDQPDPRGAAAPARRGVRGDRAEPRAPGCGRSTRASCATSSRSRCCSSRR